MEQLSGGDAIFLAMETPIAPGHVGGLSVLDVSEAEGFGFERICQVTDERIRLEPRFTRKLREVPFGLDRPYWVADPDFDVRNHIHRVAVPAPGGRRELADLTGYLFSRPLDRDRPLWEMWLVEGVAEGRMALIMKTHHCLMDGVAGAGLGELLCDLEPHPETAPSRMRPSTEPEPELSDLAVAARAAGNAVARPLKLARFGARIVRQSAAMVASSLLDPEAPPLPTAVPLVSFNRTLGPRRAFAYASVPLAAVKAVKREFDVTVNDVILALTGSAVRRYLLDRGELPEQPLVALIAVSRRDAGDVSIGNAVTTVPVGWATDIDDPVARLRRIHRNAAKSKEFARNYDVDFLAGAGESLSPLATNLTMRSFAGMISSLGTLGNMVVSNVRATPVPLYVGGAKIESMSPLSILGPSQGLNATVVSYMGHVDVGFTVDPQLVPDPWVLADAIPQALDELLSATSRSARSAA